MFGGISLKRENDLHSYDISLLYLILKEKIKWSIINT